MDKSPLDMSYKELDNLLDSLLKAEGLPNCVKYKSDSINYNRFSKIRLYVRAFYINIESKLFYNFYIKKRFFLLEKTDLSGSLWMHLHLFRFILPDLLNGLRGKFDNKIFTNYATAAMLYDEACDNLEYRKYLGDFDKSIMLNKDVETVDNYLRLFKESLDYLKNNIDSNVFSTFTKYMKIQHISQLMSIYQKSDKPISRKDLFKITLSKGGICVLAGIHLMAPNLSEEEKKAVFELGGVLQIREDVTDIKEDLSMGIQTLPNQKLINRQELRQLFIGTVNNLITQLNIDPNCSNGTLDIFTHMAYATSVKKTKKQQS